MSAIRSNHRAAHEALMSDVPVSEETAGDRLLLAMARIEGAADGLETFLKQPRAFEELRRACQEGAYIATLPFVPLRFACLRAGCGESKFSELMRSNPGAIRRVQNGSTPLFSVADIDAALLANKLRSA